MVSGTKQIDLKAPQEGPFFTEQDVLLLHEHRVPHHIAIITDGIRRWAENQGVPFVNAYLIGAQALIKTALAAKELKVRVLTAYSFSTENWKRSENETDLLMHLFDMHLHFYADSLVRSDIRLCIIGDLEGLPLFLQKTIGEVVQKTAQGKALDLVLAMNYGGRDEIVRAFKKLIGTYQGGDQISEETISKALDTHPWPDPDLLIRTSGEQRLSNFLLWQSSYAEVYTDQIQWPEFSPQHLLRAIIAYQTRNRRCGGSK